MAANLLNKQWLTVVQTRIANSLLGSICVMTSQIWAGLLAGVCDDDYESADFSVWTEEGCGNSPLHECLSRVPGAYWLRDAPKDLTFNNCTLTHAVFMCYVFISEQTATCATYSIN